MHRPATLPSGDPMPSLSNLRMPAKLYGSAAVILTLIAIMAATSWSAFHKIEAAFVSVRQSAEISQLAQTAQLQMSNAAYANLGLSKAQTPEELTLYEGVSTARRTQAIASVRRALAAAAGDDERRLLDALLKKMEAYGEISEKGLELRRAYIERKAELLVISPKLADAMAYALSQAIATTPLLVNPTMSANQGLTAARAAMLLYLLSNGEEDAEKQDRALKTAQAAIQMAAGLAGGTAIEGVIDSVAEMTNDYESSASLLMALAQRSNALWYEEARAARAELDAAADATTKHLMRVADGAIASATASIADASAVLGGVSVLVLLVVIGLNWLTVRLVARPIVRITGVMSDLAHGDKNVAVPYLGRGDEVGGIAEAVQVFKDNALRLDAMAAEQAEAGGKAADHRQHPRRGGASGGVGHRVRGLHHLDHPRRATVAVARHHQAVDEAAAPVGFERARHRARRLARADHHRAPRGRLRNLRREADFRRGGGEAGVEHVAEKTGVRRVGGDHRGGFPCRVPSRLARRAGRGNESPRRLSTGAFAGMGRFQAARIRAMKSSTSLSRRSDCCASSPAAARSSLAPAPARPAASVTSVMWEDTSRVPAAACSTFRAISAVAAVCSSTAEAMVAWMPLIRAMIVEISWIASTASPVELCTSPI
ncbi:hypothetical protein KL86APRO_30451 [uncultured Alphaproteobacteria bacterium]|uniref:HAMP domain-containing protein n=1 Tax=uncultured Alphaproteobacteria bacterium TaxID=91750 RepID=A0A212KMU5_9PROT|nr:hypothetical protein KL86APRO_30451 [uncultured Alphaproteobacteria bacterium]